MSGYNTGKGSYDYFYNSNTFPIQEQVQVTQAAATNGGTT